ncbi:DUF1569 domain-containing protein [Enterococcus italicus]|uniref:DinB-like domain-containing protein n=1 Tax=Enterococcus italicus (strain DSM 15952 / CCUG 50447 / LMG 22039 / TP 1.5) TaxID=888064 RepID=E6LDB3_ENTI1|nr:DUF1569 domain-containing protein [Enterococcus italicus]EFU74787.1 hypothetical protein HMPREF9088_0353 [Enterococcus italicus DSM 15952]OJG60664.1 hypothetical protein RT43_GL001675 [Enterococcus italicus DSM 15952]
MIELQQIPHQFASLDEALNILEQLKENESVCTKNWSVYEICLHCAQTIDYSMTGYPEMKPKLIRQTIGKKVVKKFLTDKKMSHNLQAPVAGGAPIAHDGLPIDGIQALIDATHRFQAWDGELQEHGVFGELSKEEYATYFALHIADHFQEIKADSTQFVKI